MRYFTMLVLVAGFAFSGMSSLKVLPGVREAGMGNAGVACGTGAQAMVWNPAGPAGVQGFAVRVSYAEWFLDTHQQSAFLVRNLGFANLGLGAASFTGGRFEYRTEVPTEEPLGSFTPSDFNFHLNLSRSFSRMVQLGITGRYYFSKIMDSEADGPGIDLGVRVLPVDGLVLGASVVDFGENLCYYREPFRLPTRARLGASYRLCLGEKAGLSLAGEGSYFLYTQKFNIHSGVEFSWFDVLALRAGYERLDQVNRFGFGLGLSLGQFCFDYCFTPLNDNLGAAHRVSLGLGS